MQHYTSKLLATITILYSLTGYAQSSNPSVSIVNWQGNRKAAVCVTLDDGCDQQFVTARPIMDKLGIKGTFFIITNLDYNCDGGPEADPTIAVYDGTGSTEYWDSLQNTINLGHEIGAHTVHHPDLDAVFNTYGIDSVAKEISLSKATLEKLLHQPNSKEPYNILTFAYPYGSGQDNDTIIDSVQAHFIAARGAGTATYAHTWDTYANATAPPADGFLNYYYQVESYACTDTLDINWYNTMLDSTIQDSGWLNVMYHNIGGNSLQGDEYSVSATNFQAQMEAIVAQESNLWIAPFKDVARYSKENINSKATVISSKNGITTIGLTTTLTDTNFCVPLTLLVSNFSCTCSVDSVKQAGKQLAFSTPNTSELQFNALPLAGNITIYTHTGGAVTALAAPSVTDYFELYQNVPNPSSSATAISYNLKQAGAVTLELFDITGATAKTLVNEQQTSGKYSYSLSTDNLQAGIYFYRLSSGNAFDVKKMVVIR